VWPLVKRTANTEQNSGTPEMFAAMDRDRDGFLTKEEIESADVCGSNGGDDGSGASRTRNVHPPGSPEVAARQNPDRKQK